MAAPLPAGDAGVTIPSGRIRVRVHYPAGPSRIVLRSDADWDRDLEPDTISDDGQRHEFELLLDRPFGYFKPVALVEDRTHWALGDDVLVTTGSGPRRDVYPRFFDPGGCSACELKTIGERVSGAAFSYRVFYPPGYAENPLKRYPVSYMQDGPNLFFAEEAFGGAHWGVTETLATLDAMNAVREMIVVGVYPHDREREYTSPGYEAYGRFLVEELKAVIDATYRTLPGREHTAVMGSSLGGVVSFYCAWQWPHVFGKAACLSSTFGFRDDLFDRVRREPRPGVRFYLDSGWPRDNYEVTRAMRDLLVHRGFVEGQDLFYLAFPHAQHNEAAWSTRLHIPMQFLFRAGGETSQE